MNILWILNLVWRKKCITFMINGARSLEELNEHQFRYMCARNRIRDIALVLNSYEKKDQRIQKKAQCR